VQRITSVTWRVTILLASLLTRGDRPALSAHVLVAEDEDCHAERRGLEHLLEERFDVHHTTLQVDHATPEVIELSHKEYTGEGLEHSH
jgi:cobalt-zinc-cadmium efflux system protein